jgi:hypothetical protein
MMEGGVTQSAQALSDGGRLVDPSIRLPIGRLTVFGTASDACQTEHFQGIASRKHALEARGT